jgi:hypothetical protein
MPTPQYQSSYGALRAANPSIDKAHSEAKRLYGKVAGLAAPRGCGTALADLRRRLRRVIEEIASGSSVKEAGSALRCLERARSLSMRCEALIDALSLEPALEGAPLASWQQLAAKVSTTLSSLCEEKRIIRAPKGDANVREKVKPQRRAEAQARIADTGVPSGVVSAEDGATGDRSIHQAPQADPAPAPCAGQWTTDEPWPEEDDSKHDAGGSGAPT